jgi:hypothetical protein
MLASIPQEFQLLLLGCHKQTLGDDWSPYEGTYLVCKSQMNLLGESTFETNRTHQ